MDLKKALARLGGDADQLASEYEKLAGTLRKFGLSEYESRAYVALVGLSSGSANIVAEISHIPRTSAYKTMKALETKGFVSSLPGRPQAYAAVDPSEISARLVADVEDGFSKLSKLKDLLSEKGVPQLVYTIMGKERVLDKIGEMLEKAQHKFVISTPSISDIRRGLSKRFASAVSRGVEITVITRPFAKAPRGAKVVRREGLIATDVISDGKTALLAAPDLSACGYTDNEALSKHLEEFLRIMGDRTA